MKRKKLLSEKTAPVIIAGAFFFALFILCALLFIPNPLAAGYRLYIFPGADTATGALIKFVLPLIFAASLAVRAFILKKKAEILRGIAVFFVFSVVISGAASLIPESPVKFIIFWYLLFTLPAIAYLNLEKALIAAGKYVSGAGALLKFIKVKITAPAARLAASGGKMAKSIISDRTFLKRVYMTALVFLAVGAAFVAGRAAYDAIFVNVKLSPDGEAQPESVITAKFSQPVSPKTAGKIDCFKITPPVEGTYELKGNDTIVFRPASVLAPATDYTVEMDTSLFEANNKKLAENPKESFHTPYLRVTGCNYFYNKDQMKDQEKQLMMEVSFNYPVSDDELKNNISVKKIEKENPADLAGSESDAGFTIEKTGQQNRYYIKVEGVQKSFKDQSVILKIDEGLGCKSCGSGLKSAYSKKINIAASQHLKVEGLSEWPDKARKYIAIKFNMPVSADEIKKYVKVMEHDYNSGDQEVTITAVSEYVYGVLQADFKPEHQYDVKVDSGMKSETGEELESAFSQQHYMERIQPVVGFAEQGQFISPDGDMVLPVTAMNTENINIEVWKMFKNNFFYIMNNSGRYRGYRGYGGYGAMENMGKLMLSASQKIDGYEPNKEFTEYISLKKYQKEPYKGVFLVNVSGEGGYYSENSSKIVVCTNIGLMAKEQQGDLMVKAFSIKNLGAMPGVVLKLISHNNQVIAQKTTGLDGRAVFNNYMKNDYGFVPTVIMAESGEDFTYMAFGDSQLNSFNFDTSGAPEKTAGMTAFLTSDRGLYRPGEAGRFTAIVRDKNMSVPPGIMVTLKINGPQGENIFSGDKKLERGGIAVYEFRFHTAAMTGQYTASLFVNRSDKIGSTDFKVEEFIPDKLTVSVLSDRQDFIAGEPIKFKVKSNQMFGPPAAGNKVDAKIQFVALQFESKKYPEYIFSDPDRTYQPREERLGEQKLNGIGEYVYDFELPGDLNPPSALQAQVYADVYDDGGRPVGGFKSFRVYPYDSYIGIKTRTDRRAFKTGDRVTFDIVAVGQDDSPQSIKQLQVTVKKRVWFNMSRRYWWREDNYQSVDYKKEYSTALVEIKNGRGEYSFDAREDGEYFVFAGDENAMRTGMIVKVNGARTETYDMEKSDRLDISFDKAKYSLGDTASVTVNSPFPGMLYLTVERDKVYREIYADVKKGSVTVKVNIDNDLFPNGYISAVVVRKSDEKYQGMPFLAYGVANIEIDRAAKDLKPVITADEETKSNSGIKVKLKCAGGMGTAVMLYAVDEGIMQVVRFGTPDPLAYFYAKRKLSVKTFTTLSKLLTDVRAPKQPVGGDYGEPQRKHLNPIMARNAEPFAKFSGVLYADFNGEVQYTFDSKDFNGKARIMALCADKEKFGSAEKLVNVSDALVITPNIPRFLAPGDTFESSVRVFNNTGAEGEFEIRLDAKGTVKVKKDSVKVKLANKGEASVSFGAEAEKAAGVAELTFSAAGNNIKISVKKEISVRPPAHTETVTYKGELAPGESVKKDVEAGYTDLLKKVKMQLAFSRFAECAGALEYLIHYPYGCIEQTTSTTFPMIFFKDMGLDNTSISDSVANVNGYVDDGIKRLGTFLMPSGRLSFWPGGDWEAPPSLQLFAAHMLIEAKNRGFDVPDDLYKKVLDLVGLSENDSISLSGDYVDDYGYYDGYSAQGQDKRIYKLYLRSLSGAPDRPALEYAEKMIVAYYLSDKALSKKIAQCGFTDARLKELGGASGAAVDEAGRFAGKLSEADKYLLSLAFSLADLRPAARLLLKDKFESTYTGREMWGWFNSYNKMMGMYLLACAEADQSISSRVIETENLAVSRLEKNGSFGCTMENCWVLMGLAASNKYAGKSNLVAANVYVNGKAVEKLSGIKSRAYSDLKNEWNDVRIENTGSGKFYYSIEVEGIPKEKKSTSVSDGLSISREYYDENGLKLDLNGVKQGQLAVVSISIEPAGKPLSNVVIVDMLPAGFEIENPRIRSRGEINFSLPQNMDLASQDIRDDRMILFTKSVKAKQTFAYTVRAVTPGKYVIPNIFAEAMYDPDIKAEAVENRLLSVAPDR